VSEKDSHWHIADNELENYRPSRYSAGDECRTGLSRSGHQNCRARRIHTRDGVADACICIIGYKILTTGNLTLYAIND
jgi:hypothetical protein